MTELILLFIGTVIGAGFATGAELVTFFGTSSSPLLVATLYALISITIIIILVKSSPNSSTPTQNSQAQTPAPSKAISAIFRVLYLVFFLVMTAGLKYLVGWQTTALALLFCVAVTMFGFSKMALVNKYMMLFVLAILLTATLPYSFQNLFSQNSLGASSPPNPSLAALLYASLNCTMLPTFLPHALARYSPRRVILAGSIATLTVALFIVLILTAINATATTAEMPLLALSPSLITKIAVALAIVSSMLLALSGATSSPKNKLALTTSTCLLAFACAFLGFRNLLGFIYPIVAALFLLYVSALCLRQLLRIHNPIYCLQIIKRKTRLPINPRL